MESSVVKTKLSDYEDEVSEPDDGVCGLINNNLGLSSYWWILPFIQLFLYLLLFSLQTLCNLATVLSFITIHSINTFYFNFSLWVWLVFALVSMTYCRIGQSTNVTFLIFTLDSIIIYKLNVI